MMSPPFKGRLVTGLGVCPFDVYRKHFCRVALTVSKSNLIKKKRLKWLEIPARMNIRIRNGVKGGIANRHVKTRQPPSMLDAIRASFRASSNRRAAIKSKASLKGAGPVGSGDFHLATRYTKDSTVPSRRSLRSHKKRSRQSLHLALLSRHPIASV